MNERIEELIKQAGFKTEAWLNLDGTPKATIYKEVIGGNNLAKFAELIVLECMDVFGNDLPEPGIDGRMTDVIDRICNVAEHFGVDNERTN
jgi:hypothetical protein